MYSVLATHVRISSGQACSHLSYSLHFSRKAQVIFHTHRPWLSMFSLIILTTLFLKSTGNIPVTPTLAKHVLPYHTHCTFLQKHRQYSTHTDFGQASSHLSYSLHFSRKARVIFQSHRPWPSMFSLIILTALFSKSTGNIPLTPTLAKHLLTYHTHCTFLEKQW